MINSIGVLLNFEITQTSNGNVHVSFLQASDKMTSQDIAQCSICDDAIFSIVYFDFIYTHLRVNFHF